MTPIGWILAFAVTAGAASVQGVVGIGYALVAVPLLAAINPSLAPVPQLLTVLPLTVVMAWKERKAIDLDGVGWLIAGRVPGAILGVGLLTIVSPQALNVMIGAIVLAAVAILGFGLHIRRTTGTKIGAGVASGATSIIAAVGGPPTALLYSSSEAATIRSTLAAVFAFGVTLTVAMRAVSGNVTSSDVGVALVLMPAVVIGWLLSLRFKDLLPKEMARTGLLAVSAVSAVALIVRALAT